VPIPYADLTYSNEVAFTHGSPWNYDSYVPLLFVNPNFKPTRITRLAYTTDIAPTLTSLMVIKAPSSAVGKPLQEVTRFYD
jgi:arylsulfatase A-like enzyme